MASPTIQSIPDKDKEGTVSNGKHGKGKRSIDGGRSGERLSIFGGTFSSSLGKGRKPPPR
jgi:hypothetical protein